VPGWTCRTACCGLQGSSAAPADYVPMRAVRVGYLRDCVFFSDADADGVATIREAAQPTGSKGEVGLYRPGDSTVVYPINQQRSPSCVDTLSALADPSLLFATSIGVLPTADSPLSPASLLTRRSLRTSAMCCALPHPSHALLCPAPQPHAARPALLVSNRAEAAGDHRTYERIPQWMHNLSARPLPSLLSRPSDMLVRPQVFPRRGRPSVCSRRRSHYAWPLRTQRGPMRRRPSPRGSASARLT
jgi:hypothetical protein